MSALNRNMIDKQKEFQKELAVNKNQFLREKGQEKREIQAFLQ